MHMHNSGILNDTKLEQIKVKISGLETTHQVGIQKAKTQFAQSTTDLNYNTNLLI